MTMPLKDIVLSDRSVWRFAKILIGFIEDGCTVDAQILRAIADRANSEIHLEELVLRAVQ